MNGNARSPHKPLTAPPAAKVGPGSIRSSRRSQLPPSSSGGLAYHTNRIPCRRCGRPMEGGPKPWDDLCRECEIEVEREDREAAGSAHGVWRCSGRLAASFITTGPAVSQERREEREDGEEV
jgi:hypothetical protein